jgi:hypothetical protein
MTTMVDPAGGCHLLESGDSLRASGSPATLTAGMDANESVESSGALQSL